MFRDEDAHAFLFKYMSDRVFLDHFFRDRRLRIAPLDEMNDPRESRDWVCALVADAEGTGDLDVFVVSAAFTEALKGRAKVLCFTRDDPALDPNRREHLYGRGYAHSSMWDRYATEHRGVCLVFDMIALDEAVARSVAATGALYHRSVTYDDMPSPEVDAFSVRASALEELGVEHALKRHVDRHHATLYFFRSTDWQREFEYRWLLLSESRARYEYVDTEDALRGVILGADFAGDVSAVRSALAPDVLLARMSWRNGHPIPLPAMI